MKLFYTISLGVIISFTASGQNFRALKGGTEYIYSGYQTSLVGVKADSVHFDGDSIYFPSKKIRGTSGSGFCQYDVYGPSWLGSHIRIQSDGTHLFFNVLGDSIFIHSQAGLNESWTAWEGLDGRYVTATVNSIELQDVLGVMDLVKSFSFQMYNPDMEPVSHQVNSIQFSLSENFGMVNALSFIRFPEAFNSNYTINEYPGYTISGISNPSLGIQNLTAAEIWDFAVNDTIQSKHGTHSFGNVSETIAQRVYINRTDYADSIVYELERTLGFYTGTFPNNVELQSLTIDTIQAVILTRHPLNTLPICSQVYLDIEEPFNNSANEFRMEAGEHRKKLQQDSFFGSSYEYYPDDGCWHEIIDVGCFSGHYFEYIEGLGGPYIQCQVGAAYSYYSELIYYNKSGTTWGTPIALSTNNASSKANFAKVYPNPATDFIRVELPPNALPATISFFDLSGRILLERQVFQTESHIELTKLLPGFYTYLISSSESMMQSGKLVVR